MNKLIRRPLTMRLTVIVAAVASLICIAPNQTIAQCPVPTAVADVVLSPVTGDVPMSVVYNPGLDIYYSVSGNTPNLPIETFNSAGTLLLSSANSGHDWRGAWWNPSLGQLEGNSCSSCQALGVRVQNLNASGYAISTGTTVLAPNQPDFQAKGVLDYDAGEIIYYFNGRVELLPENWTSA